MQVGKRIVVAQTRRAAAVLKKIVEFVCGGHCRRAAVAGNHNRATSVGSTTTFGDWVVPQPTREKSRHEGIARAEHIEHVDLKTRADDATLDLRGDGAGKRHASFCTALQHD